MNNDWYFELLEEQHNHDVIMITPSHIDIDTSTNKHCNNDYCEIGSM